MMPMNRKDYPKEWEAIRREVLERAEHRCELCDAKNYEPHWKTGSKVILTVHHKDSNKKNNNKLNLIALCQRCHLKLDIEKHVKKRKEPKTSWVYFFEDGCFSDINYKTKEAAIAAGAAEFSKNPEIHQKMYIGKRESPKPSDCMWMAVGDIQEKIEEAFLDEYDEVFDECTLNTTNEPALFEAIKNSIDKYCYFKESLISSVKEYQEE